MMTVGVVGTDCLSYGYVYPVQSLVHGGKFSTFKSIVTAQVGPVFSFLK